MPDDFDRVTRRAIRDAPEPHLRWLLPRLPEGLSFQCPLESQSAARPGEPQRRCDTIFELGHPGGLGVPWAVVVEVFSGADADALDRLGEYLFRFRREVRHGPHGQDRYRWAGVLLFLAEGPDEAQVKDALAGGSLHFKPTLVRGAKQGALATLRAIRENRLGAAILAWVPLMRGGQTERAVRLWREACELREPSEQRRRELASQAEVLAEITKCEEVWQAGLEGFAMKESKILKRERVEARREDVLRVLRARFKEAADPLAPRVESEIDFTRLGHWIDIAATESLEKIREEIGA